MGPSTLRYQGNVDGPFRHACRNASVDRELDQRVLNLVLGTPVVQRAADVQLELRSAVESPEHRQVQQAAITPGERLAAPARTPAVLRYEPLEVAREVVRLGQSGSVYWVPKTSRRIWSPFSNISSVIVISSH